MLPASETGISDLHLRSELINILIVDDDQKNLTVLETILNEPIYRLIRAETADQALLALVSEEFALLILDVQLPGMTGFELAQIIKERKKTARIPIIFLTAYYNEDQHMMEGYGSGAVDYLHKPVNSAVLRSKVAVFVDLYRKNREVEKMNETLMDEISERRRIEEELRELNETLEKRVHDRTEELRTSHNRKDQFLATLAHELRNPLAPIRNATFILRKSVPSHLESKWAAEVIERQLQSMTRLIEDLMDVNRINQGKIELRKEPIFLAKVIESAIEVSQPLIDEHGHTLSVDIPLESIRVIGDFTRLMQVILNLLNNAAKFSPSGSQIYITARRLEKVVEIKVKDNGIGISSQHLKSIFEMFSQVDSAISRSQGGLGLGLYLVKQIVELHEGRIEAKSEGYQKGSEFVIDLPIILNGQEPPIIEEQITENSSTTSLRIVIVDDNRDAAMSLSMLLEISGEKVWTCFDGTDCVELAAKHLPHAILLDIGLPKMNGYEVARTIRKEKWGQSIFLIATTGWGQDDDRHKAKEAGFDLHFVKPVDPALIIHELNQIRSKLIEN